jgi:hypothetical protein
MKQEFRFFLVFFGGGFGYKEKNRTFAPRFSKGHPKGSQNTNKWDQSARSSSG